MMLSPGRRRGGVADVDADVEVSGALLELDPVPLGH